MHVDFAVLFNKWELLPIPETIPFRLTHKSELFRDVLVNNSTFENQTQGVSYSGIIKWSDNFGLQEKDEIRNNLDKYKQKNDKYSVVVMSNMSKFSEFTN
jgi:hypothetical protein